MLSCEWVLRVGLSSGAVESSGKCCLIGLKETLPCMLGVCLFRDFLLILFFFVVYNYDVRFLHACMLVMYFSIMSSDSTDFTEFNIEMNSCVYK